MGKPRVRGNHAKIYITDSKGVAVEVGEISKFTVKELGEVKKSRGIGQNSITSNKTFEGYDLSFEGGKVDWNLAQMLHRQDELIYKGNRAPGFTVSHTVYFFDGSVEIFTYNDVTIYGYNLDIDANDELMEKFEGFCGTLRIRSNSGKSETDNSKNAKTVDDLLLGTLAKEVSILSDTTLSRTLS
jgi:hypothetical protein